MHHLTRAVVAAALALVAVAPAAHADPPICTIRGCVEQVCRDHGIDPCPL